jgi:hypothetical protein
MADELVNLRVDGMRAAESMIRAFRTPGSADANEAFNQFVGPGFEGSADRAAFLAAALSAIAVDLLGRLAVYEADPELVPLDLLARLAGSQITRNPPPGGGHE